MPWRLRLAALFQVQGWRVPWYFDCRHSTEWTNFRNALEVLDGTYQEEVFWWAQALLERIEPSFLRVQNTDHLFFLCNPNGTIEDDDWVPVQSDEESIFRLSTGTSQWSNEEREQRSHALGDFCYFGYMAAIAYRTRNTDASIAGILEGRQHAMQLLQNFLMSRANSVDFLDSSGWLMTHELVLKHLYPPDGPPRRWATIADDPSRPVNSLQLEATNKFSDGLQAQLHVAAIGYHTTLVLELISLWEEFLSDQLRLHFAVHVLEPGLGDARQVRAASVCKDFEAYGDLCGWDARLLSLNQKHIKRVKLPISGLPSPQIEDPSAFVEDFIGFFAGLDSDSFTLGQTDPRIQGADLLLCTEPAFLCNALGRSFPHRPLLGYFANPLTAYVPAFAAESWLQDFVALTKGLGRSAPFMAVASTRFLGEQMRFQTGATRVFAARPLAAYLGPVRGSSKAEVVVLRQPSMFWNSACILNSLVRMNMQELQSMQSMQAEGLKATSLRFTPSEELPDASSEAIASFAACVIYPYDVSQMRLYELYALSVPLFVPSRAQLPSYIYRGLTSIEDFDHVLPDAGFQGGWRKSDIGPHLDFNPFDREWRAADAWTQLTHWVSLPHLVRFESSAQLLSRLMQENLRSVSAAMRRQQERDVIRAVRFWTAALSHLGEAT
ncbi:unnamed protein product [Effrenium voratum]|uniref:Uncharacterized protein n=1 Tax=Effrenium voratum TaxID=2562239 RepID=A0AA36HY42_9DINO|nr:unnamed protein product [Effrenium voratum]CAJ1424030.1 unnamed protein product [Effrenium voratum]